MSQKKRDAARSPNRNQSPMGRLTPQVQSPTEKLYPKLSSPGRAGDASTTSDTSWRENGSPDQQTDSEGEEDRGYNLRSHSTLNESNMPEQFSDFRSDETDSSFDGASRKRNIPKSTRRSRDSYMHSPEPRPNLRGTSSTPGNSTPSVTPETHVRSRGPPHPGYTPILHDNHTKARGDAEDGGRMGYMYILIVVMLFVGGFLGYTLFVKPQGIVPNLTTDTRSVDVSQRDEMVGVFMKDLREMRQSFPNQSNRFWSTLAATTKSVLKTVEPRQPGIILLAGSNSSMGTMKCIEKELSYMITAAYEDSKNAVRLPIEQHHLSIPHAELKLLIDEEFSSGLSTGSRVAVLQNLHWVPGKAAMMFHAYCDNESAPYKDAIIVFTFELDISDERIKDMSDFEISRAVEHQLQSKWEREIGVDNTMALLSRVANNVAVVRGESTEILKNNGCKT